MPTTDNQEVEDKALHYMRRQIDLELRAQLQAFTRDLSETRQQLHDEIRNEVHKVRDEIRNQIMEINQTIRTEVGDLRNTLKQEYVHEYRFRPIALVVYGMVAAILGGFIAALVLYFIPGSS